jgi:hypothetical protein
LHKIIGIEKYRKQKIVSENLSPINLSLSCFNEEIRCFSIDVMPHKWLVTIHNKSNQPKLLSNSLATLRSHSIVERLERAMTEKNRKDIEFTLRILFIGRCV